MLVILDFFVVDLSICFFMRFHVLDRFWVFGETYSFDQKPIIFFGNSEYRRHTYDLKRRTNDHLLIFTIETKFVCKEFHRCWLFWIFSWSMCQCFFHEILSFGHIVGIWRNVHFWQKTHHFLVISSTGDTHTISNVEPMIIYWSLQSKQSLYVRNFIDVGYFGFFRGRFVNLFFHEISRFGQILGIWRDVQFWPKTHHFFW